ncbi:trypsin-like peptidase domain-containing protein [Chitinophaga japonensis]|uniref:Trypsin-like peptidase n=1 Tax=Chitinophaga japonensis TaxID=104662 RepID=A0A562SL80_CHIJA|nr:trypsin-like peptidase domain-containing protein [Chitinophaga japonensis]TWI81982.1 hypothetical protein LX66_5298 [Chitinophaga japonensis]
MKKQIQTELHAIQGHINRNFRRWFKRYPNLEGVHVGPKKVKGATLPACYAIVFHVSRKKQRPGKPVPKFLRVKKGDQDYMKVPTDVIQTGKMKLAGIKIGERTKNQHSSLVGTISFYFSTPNGVYLGSNMHVLAPQLLRSGQVFYDARKGDPPQSIRLFNDVIASTARLTVAVFNGIDFGFAKVDNPQVPEVIERIIKEVGAVKGVFGLTRANVHTAQLSFYGISSGRRPCAVTELGAVKNTNLQHIFLTNLIKLSRCTLDGDSGAPVFDQQNRLVGVIIGRDDDASYALHISDITRFFQSSNL